MSKVTVSAFEVKGPAVLQGTIPIEGAKNAVLPAMAASLLVDQPVVLSRVPEVEDVHTMGALLASMGVDVAREGDTLRLVSPGHLHHYADYELVRKMRAGILVLGPLLAREGQASVALPGGCAIGVRPVNLHLEGLRRMGAEIHLEKGDICATAKKLRGCSYTFPRKSVTGTENLMMAAALAEGTTVLRNAAREPEVLFLAEMLKSMGTPLQWEGDTIIMQGTTQLRGGSFTIPPDRIETGTYVLMALACPGSRVILTQTEPSHLAILWEILEEVGGGSVDIGKDTITITASGSLKARSITTAPYPGFPTDLQAQYMALMTQAEGTAEIRETIFEQRFHHVAELRRMGASIHIDDGVAWVKGPTPLEGTTVMATDLRASASLVLAGLCARGRTVISRIYHLDRGYACMEKKLRHLGVSIQRIRVPLT